MPKRNESQVILTRSGHQKLVEELTHLKTVGRQEVANQLEVARGFGDLSENAEYTAAKEEQAKVESRISELENMLGKVTVVDEKKLDTSRVAIGLTVTLEDLDSPGNIYTYALVGSEELSSLGISAGNVQRISQRSPVGQAIIDHVEGDEVEVVVPRGTRRLKIISINREK